MIWLTARGKSWELDVQPARHDTLVCRGRLVEHSVFGNYEFICLVCVSPSLSYAILTVMGF